MKNPVGSQTTAALDRVSHSSVSASHHAADATASDDHDRARKKIYLHPGQLYAIGESAAVTTILGSCVAVCLYDPVTQIGGVNHFLLPVAGTGGPKSPRFGNVAVPDLVDKVVKLGAEPKRLQAKLFGGANVIEAFRDRENHLGTQNVRIARELLAAEAIPVISEDVGGQKGRKLVFLTNDGSAWIKEL
jgi:chemotaxis protein CheD